MLQRPEQQLPLGAQ
ncbi:hypothetical protein VCHC56A1_2664, partial [Vibrio cholerae HC-56A1]